MKSSQIICHDTFDKHHDVGRFGLPRTLHFIDRSSIVRFSARLIFDLDKNVFAFIGQSNASKKFPSYLSDFFVLPICSLSIYFIFIDVTPDT